MRLKPKIFVDIVKKGKLSPFSERSRRVNLSFKAPNKQIKTAIRFSPLFGALMLVALLNGQVFAPIVAQQSNAQTIQITTDERHALEAELKLLEEQMAQQEKTITELNRQGVSLKNEISILDTKISKLNLQIRAVNLSISKLDDEIDTTAEKIAETQSDIDIKRITLTKTLKNIYLSGQSDYIEVLLQNPRISDFFNDINNLELLQNNLRGVLEGLVASHDELVGYREQLGLKRTDAAALKSYQDSQKAAIASTKGEKDILLKVTKGKESEYQKYLADNRQKAAEIRSRIFQFLGGGELTFEKAYELAKHAESATGIRAALILAILDRESALGSNVGRCDYDKNPYYPDRTNNKTTMHPTRDIPKFLDIINRLNLQRDLENGIIKVSCPIPRDGAYGGAMGPAQFIPSTWAMYEPRISAVTGSKPPSPWSNTDAIVGTALYIKDAYNSSGCIEYSQIIPSSAQRLRERCAAAKYYAGSNWHTYRWAYGEPTVDRADRFQRDIDILNS